MTILRIHLDLQCLLVLTVVYGIPLNRKLHCQAIELVSIHSTEPGMYTGMSSRNKTLVWQTRTNVKPQAGTKPAILRMRCSVFCWDVEINEQFQTNAYKQILSNMFDRDFQPCL